jgi:hypothetical protein
LRFRIGAYGQSAAEAIAHRRQVPHPGGVKGSHAGRLEFSSAASFLKSLSRFQCVVARPLLARVLAQNSAHHANARVTPRRTIAAENANKLTVSIATRDPEAMKEHATTFAIRGAIGPDAAHKVASAVRGIDPRASVAVSPSQGLARVQSSAPVEQILHAIAPGAVLRFLIALVHGMVRPGTSATR